jgi:peptidyl-prolyl cis-trans isomerase D
MFDFVYRHKRALQLILALLIIPPFAFFGVDSYLRDGSTTAPVGTVNGHSIGQQEFNIALRERQEMLQQMSGGKVDAALLDNPEMRFSVAESLANQQVLLQHASRNRMVATDEQLRILLGQAPTFQEDGKFSQALYDQFLASRGKSAPAFENDLRRDLVLRQVNDPYSESNFLPRTVVQQLARLMETQREASIYTLQPSDFESKATVDGEASKKYYDSHPDEFRIPEQVRVEYVTHSVDALLPATEVDPEDVKKAFDDQAKRVQVQEARQASHILIAVDAKASADDKKKAQARAEELLKQVKAKPASFADVAKANSQDPGSAAKGGDLGSFKRPDMVKPFSDAAFSMKVGEISGVVQSDFGYHIIKLNGISETKPPSFDAQRPQIETELKRQRAGKKFSEMAEQFNNMVFEQSDSLKSAADFTKSTILQSNFFARTGAASDPRLNNPKLLQAIFSDDVLKNKRNTEAVEVAPGVMIAARVLEHKPSVLRPFDQAQVEIVSKLIRSRAVQLAAQEGRAKLENLRKGQAEEIKWGTSQLVSFSSQAKDLSDDVRKQILRTDVSKLPAYTGVETPAGYTLIRIARTVEAEKIDAEKEKNISAAMLQAQGQEQNAAFLASLRQKADIKIRKEQLSEKKEK